MTTRKRFLELIAASAAVGFDSRLLADIVNDGGRLQPSVARAKRPEKIDDMATYLKWKWRTDVSDHAMGLDNDALKKGLDAVLAEWKGKESWPVVKARLVDYLVDNVALGFSRFDCFPAISCWNRWDRPISKILREREREVEKATAPVWLAKTREEIYATGGKCYRDYDHSSPDWAVILKLGFPGMKARVEKLSNRRIVESSNEEQRAFYESELRVANAILRFIDRLVAAAEAELARCGGKTQEGLLEKEIASLKRLRVGPPVTVFDVMQFTFVDFIVSEYFDRFQVRCFGQIDRLWRPYYERDLREGRTTEAEFREEFRHLIWQFGSIDNYWGHPLFLGGTAADGTTEYNPLSLVMLDVIDREALPTPKIQLKIAKNTPDFIWDKALRMLRNHRSVVLMGEEGMARSMARIGLSADECRRLIVWGCFEWLPPEGNCTSACGINLAKPVVQMLKDAKDGKLGELGTFDDFKREYYRRLGEVTDKTRKVLDYLESGLADINPSLVLSLGIGSALEKGEDAFATGMRYNNTTMSEVAFATAVDSLIAVKELVYEKNELSLAELGGVLAKNWEGHEELRLRMSRSHRKWGCGNDKTDALGHEVLETFTGRFVGLPNARGGKYCCYGLNSRGYINAGKATGATPDGRTAGEELSKNMAPAIGGDAEGITAVLKSWRTSVDPAFFPCGLVFDVMLHSSSVAGEKGLVALRAICEEYFAAGGCGLNLNIQSVEELKDAQLHPEKYENLQVRVAGWNIRWNDIPKKEQDGFIRRLGAMPEWRDQGSGIRDQKELTGMKKSVMGMIALLSVVAFGRGEGWVPKPPMPPPVATLTNEARYIEWKWREDVTDPKTGVTQEQAKEKLLALSKELEPKEPWNVVKATCFAWLCDNLAIDVSSLDWFPAFACWNRYARPMSPVLGRRNGEIERKFYPEILPRMYEGNRRGKWMVWKDFDHIVPDWDTVIPLGFAGMKARLLANWQEEKPYYRAEKIAAEGIERLLDRLIEKGTRDEGRGMRVLRQVESLKRLRSGAPQTAYDVMQFIYLYFVLSEHFEGVQARSLSIIDRTLWPYYERDLAAGRTTEAEFREQFRHFLWQWGSIDNYWGQPVTMGGTKADGTSEYNPLSYIILDVMDECAIPTPKFHLKIAENTPNDLLRKAFDMARRHRPLSFVGEKPTRRVLEHLGYTPDEARQFYTKGCYEFCSPKDGNGLGGGHVNLVKIVELMLEDSATNGFAAVTFDDFFAEYLKRTISTAAEVRDFFFVFERHLDDVNPALVASLAGEFSVQKGLDALSTGTKSGNKTGICLSGTGTAVDALMAVKELVYEARELSLADLGRLMAKNWEGREDLRLRMLRSKRKWGNNDAEANALCSRIVKAASAEVNFTPNSRGGRFTLSGHNARQFICEGLLTGATPDGRKKGDEFSKNLSPTMGVDTEGVTALVATLASLDSRDLPGDFPLDVMLHPSAVDGENGFAVMKALLFQYYANNGIMMQFNVFDAEELKDAQRHPEKYENLQVRVCGWNVRWNDLPKREQDAYIRRAEEIAR